MFVNAINIKRDHRVRLIQDHVQVIPALIMEHVKIRIMKHHLNAFVKITCFMEFIVRIK
jgi:hypothetical protein